MLHPTKNRINFGHALRPIKGYEVDYVIGTSYCLDLESILFLPLSLFFGEDLKIESHCTNELLTALTQVPQKVKLFCQRGKIAAPSFYHSILETWGDNIEQIQMAEYSQSFHPKIWLIRYQSVENKKAPVRYRFICTSRNLTKSTDWDVAITMDGVVERATFEENRPLFAFVQFLNAKASKKIKQEILAEIIRIKFELEPGQESYQFFPIGGKWKSPFSEPDFKANELLIVSPFLHAESISYFAGRARKLSVFSTEYELNKLPDSQFQNSVQYFQFNPLLENDIAAADEDNSLRDLSDVAVDDGQEYSNSHTLHAKVFVGMSSKTITWYIGSANCTNPARDGRNIEFLTAVSTTTGALLPPEELLVQLTAAEKHQEGIFIPFERTEQSDNAEFEQLEQDIRKAVFDISQLEINASIAVTDQRLYNYEIEIPKAKLHKRKSWTVSFQPLSGLRGRKEKIEDGTQSQKFTFTDFEIHRLTPFFLFTISENEVVLKTMVLKLEIAFPEDRMKKVFSSLVGNWERMMKYLSFLLSKEQVENLINLHEEPSLESVSNKAQQGWQAQFPIYEKLLVAASRDTQAMKQTFQLVEMLSEENDAEGRPIIQGDFIDLIKTFKSITEHDH